MNAREAGRRSELDKQALRVSVSLGVILLSHAAYLAHPGHGGAALPLLAAPPGLLWGLATYHVAWKTELPAWSTLLTGVTRAALGTTCLIGGWFISLVSTLLFTRNHG